jgi:hypothetical protein
VQGQQNPSLLGTRFSPMNREPQTLFVEGAEESDMQFNKLVVPTFSNGLLFTSATYMSAYRTTKGDLLTVSAIGCCSTRSLPSKSFTELTTIDSVPLTPVDTTELISSLILHPSESLVFTHFVTYDIHA